MSIAAWVVQADLLGSENSMLRGNRASFFSSYIATTKNWVLFFLQFATEPELCSEIARIGASGSELRASAARSALEP